MSYWITKLSPAQISQPYELHLSTSKSFHALCSTGWALTSRHTLQLVARKTYLKIWALPLTCLQEVWQSWKPTWKLCSSMLSWFFPFVTIFFFLKHSSISVKLQNKTFFFYLKILYHYHYFIFMFRKTARSTNTVWEGVVRRSLGANTVYSICHRVKELFHRHRGTRVDHWQLVYFVHAVICNCSKTKWILSCKMLNSSS